MSNDQKSIMLKKRPSIIPGKRLQEKLRERRTRGNSGEKLSQKPHYYQNKELAKY